MKKQWIIELLIGLSLPIVVCLLVFGRYLYNQPKFKVGDCIVYHDPDWEEWDGPTDNSQDGLRRIEKVGKHKYLTTFYVNDIGFTSMNSLNDEMYFEYEKWYIKVDCPKE